MVTFSKTRSKTERRARSRRKAGGDKLDPSSQTETPLEETSEHPSAADFPIVGIGASAGGLEAIEQFLSGLPGDSGMAFVIVQHLDPTRRGIMPELLQRGTRMKVMQVKDRTKVLPNCVYVIPPNRDMSILHRSLYLFEPAPSRGLRLPIDFFFRSLAKDLGDRCAAVILSGMGSDGTLGIKVIKESAGVVLVQDPASAKFDSMPRHAVETGIADVVAPADELGKKIVAICRQVSRVTAAEVTLDLKHQTALEKIAILLRAQTGHDFSLYKKSTLYRRIERRMAVHQIEKIADYVRFLQENLQERELLFNELLIGVTSFFRDPFVWAALQAKALPDLLANRPDGGQLRAWTPGCSTGEEAYSLAITFMEALGSLRAGQNCSLQIFATDLDRAAVEKARQAIYPANIAADVSPERLRRFFVKEESGRYRVRKEIRDMVTFAPQNLIMDAPFTRLDILVCRNLLIYLGPELQRKLLPLFHYSLKPNGVLLLGSAETVGTFTEHFVPLDQKARLFRRIECVPRLGPADFPSVFNRIHSNLVGPEPAAKPAPNLQEMAQHLLLERFTPPSVLINIQGDILNISGRTGNYLEPVAGRANWNVFAMAREGLRQELSSVCQKARRQKTAVVLRNLHVHTNGNGHWQTIDLTVQALEEPAAMRGLLMMVFTDVPELVPRKTGRGGKKSGPAKRAAELEQESDRLRLLVQAKQEEMQMSQEELKSTNEELQSMNEELQSTNEELTTSKEEMQSLNEEMQTVNNELQTKVDELSDANNDMKNLLNSTDIATVFLDNSLCLRRFTTQATRIIKLIPADVGRPVTDLASDLIYPGLLADVQQVLRTLEFVEKPIATRDGRWFTTRVMPYRTMDDKVDGVVITFSDITGSKKLEAALRQQHGALKARMKTGARRRRVKP